METLKTERKMSIIDYRTYEKEMLRTTKAGDFKTFTRHKDVNVSQLFQQLDEQLKNWNQTTLRHIKCILAQLEAEGKSKLCSFIYEISYNEEN